jgi:hypothetical protein
LTHQFRRSPSQDALQELLWELLPPGTSVSGSLPSLFMNLQGPPSPPMASGGFDQGPERHSDAFALTERQASEAGQGTSPMESGPTEAENVAAVDLPYAVPQVDLLDLLLQSDPSLDGSDPWDEALRELAADGTEPLPGPEPLWATPTFPDVYRGLQTSPFDVGTSTGPPPKGGVLAPPLEGDEPALWPHAFRETFALPLPSQPGQPQLQPQHPLTQPRRRLTPFRGTPVPQSVAHIQRDLKAHPGPLPGRGTSAGPRRQRVHMPEYRGAGKVPDQLQAKTSVAMRGSAISGKYPRLGGDYPLPPGASYQGQYSARTLTYLSTVAAAALTMDGIPPTEVQFGHAFNDHGDYELFASTNNLASQELLARKLTCSGRMVQEVLESSPESYRAGFHQLCTGSPKNLSKDEHERNVKHAAKLSRFNALQQRRVLAIYASLEHRYIDADEANRQFADLQLARKAFEAFAAGDVTVAMSPSNQTQASMSDTDFEKAAATKLGTVQTRLAEIRAVWNNQTVPGFNARKEREKGKGKEKEEEVGGGKRSQGEEPQGETEPEGDAPDKEGSPKIHLPNLGKVRHAEQNVAQAIHGTNEARHMQGKRLFTHAEIQGTMIRCTGCSAELGANLVDEGGLEITGRLFAAQASLEHLCEDCLRKKEGYRQTVTGTHSVQTPGSPGSPVPWAYGGSDETS